MDGRILDVFGADVVGSDGTRSDRAVVQVFRSNFRPSVVECTGTIKWTQSGTPSHTKCEALDHS